MRHCFIALGKKTTSLKTNKKGNYTSRLRSHPGWETDNLLSTCKYGLLSWQIIKIAALKLRTKHDKLEEGKGTVILLVYVPRVNIYMFIFIQ